MDLSVRPYRRQNIVNSWFSSVQLFYNPQTLQWAIVLRNAYVDPLNVLQAHVLKRLRSEEYANEDERNKLQVMERNFVIFVFCLVRCKTDLMCFAVFVLLLKQDALVVTINGISAGMRNSG